MGRFGGQKWGWGAFGGVEMGDLGVGRGDWGHFGVKMGDLGMEMGDWVQFGDGNGGIWANLGGN